MKEEVTKIPGEFIAVDSLGYQNKYSIETIFAWFQANLPFLKPI